ncbi:unnamed protein product [Acanthoscelides obtectus]|uniref:Protein odr-4 homolog n=2 Tax=Acanthoscelides obtectus TaxID=200917 RepID=A0A9P0MH53_ACAOB|nr:unnamed protein product [Acanthoscelides obtectus]CAK1652830.1 Protein odr-4 homolog [Acanthoscelides obtectus]
MVRNILASDNVLSFFICAPKDGSGVVGLIIGQCGADRDYVFYLARSPAKRDKRSSFDDIEEDLVLDHAKQISRMLPGGMNILGIVVSHPEDVTSPLHPKVKSLLSNLCKTLDYNRFYGNAKKEMIILSFIPKPQKYICKEYNISNGTLQLADFKFTSKKLKWYRIDCALLIDELYYLDKEENKSSLEEHIKAILEQIQKKLNNVEFIIDNQYKNKDECIESYFKKKISKRGSKKDDADDDRPLTALALFKQDFPSSPSMHQVKESSGSLKMTGKIISRIWVQSKTTVAEISEFLKQDIMCSLASRCEMHVDSLTEEEISEGINCIHEPPRRVLISLPDIEPMFSDYLFPGEGPLGAKTSLEELFGVKFEGKLISEDLEGEAGKTQLSLKLK